MIINILTRTSNRPKFFDINYNSVKSQIVDSNVIINHIVSYDDPTTFEYVDKYNDIIKVPVIKQNFTSMKTFPFNLYFNELHKYVKDGFIIYLDDDDTFYDNNSLQKIIPYLDINKILFWQVQFSNKIIPSVSLILSKSVSKNNCPSNSFSFHYSLLNKYNILWKPIRGGDYIFIHNLYKKHKNCRWINLIITKVPSSGVGLQIDKK